MSLTKNLLDGEHAEQSVHWASQQQPGQQQPTDGAVDSYSESADASSASNAQPSAPEPTSSPAATTTTTTSVQAWGILKDLPYHFLTS
jgi:hypothetical protein